MPASARLEIHVINVGQGDSILIVNRKLDVLRQNLKTLYTGHTDDSAVAAAEDIDLLPWAMKAQRETLASAETVMRGTVEKALLIDGAEECYGDDVVAYLELQGVLTPNQSHCPNLTLLVTHYHSDHIGGLLRLFEKAVATPSPVTINKFLARGGATKRKATKKKTVNQKRYIPADIYYTKADDENDPGTKILVSLRQCFDDAASASPGATRHKVLPGGLIRPSKTSVKTVPAVISLGTGVDGIPIQMRLIASSCHAYDQNLHRTLKADKVSKDPNDHSIVGVLEYGSFRTFLGGDIAGNGKAEGGNDSYVQLAGKKKFFSSHGDIEKIVVTALRTAYPANTATAGTAKAKTAGHCTVYKASHHASASSNDIHTMSTMLPRVAAISSGIKQRYHKHPTPEVLDRMTAPATWSTSTGTSTATVANTVKSGVYITEMASKYNGSAVNKPPTQVRLLGDIIIRPLDGTIKAVQDATTIGNILKVQVFGTGIQTALADTKQRAFRACTTGTSTPPYPIGPHLHECDEH